MRLHRGRAAIDREQQRGAARGERAHRLDIRAVAFEQAVGNVGQGIDAGVAQKARQQRGRRCAVDIVVAEDRDLLAAHDRIGKPAGCLRHGVSTFGSGIVRLIVGSRKASTASTSTLRPAGMRASSSGRSCRCAIASARADPRSSSRLRQARPVAELSTPRKSPLFKAGPRDSVPKATISK
jgi:hypothetical protein